MKNFFLKILFPQSLVAKQLTSVVRKLILVIATLMASQSELFVEAAAYLTNNVDPLSATITAGIMGVISVFWGTQEKTKK